MIAQTLSRRCHSKLKRMNDQLEVRYRSFHVSAKLPKGLSRRASAPLLVYPHERWASSGLRLLVVGQETLRWQYEPLESGGTGSAIRTFGDFSAAANGVSAMWDLYRWYGLGRRYPKLNSPFWRGFRALDSAVNAEPDSALWTNLFKVNVNGSVMENCSRAEIAKLHKAQQGLLQHEIAVLKPDAVVFFTGPRYDSAIKAEFDGVEFQLMEGLPGPTMPPSRLAWVRAPGLPAKTVRSYHPEYLQRSRQWNVISQIADWIRS